ncbi:hypothetical protein V8F06_012600 [Rhypophila decipiens]
MAADNPGGDAMKNWWASNNFSGNPLPVVASEALNRAAATAVVNGARFEEEEDDNINDELTPPPDSPIGPPDDAPVDGAAPVEASDRTTKPSEEPVAEPMKSPSPPFNSLEDEIVVGTNSRRKPTPKRGSTEIDDPDVEEAEQQPPSLTKRKRLSQHSYAIPDRPDSPPLQEEPEVRRRPVGRPKTHGMGAVKGVILGYWRDSEPEKPENKHSVTGFIDVRDRLRTRIQTTTRDGVDIVRDYPLPPGPGGSWVTFERIAFDPHLVNLDHNQVKEYVKIRAETSTPHETVEDKARLDAEAVKQAIANVERNPPPETSVPVAIAYGPDIPEHVTSNRPTKKQRMNAGSGGPSPAPTPGPHHPQVDSLPGTRPTKILLGYWKGSSELDDYDKHAVFGILGNNDMFRVKLTKETRDGRPCTANFPTGPGQIWIHWDEVAFEPHLMDLSRTEVKEYCRVRQMQIDRGEEPLDRAANEGRAVAEARMRAAMAFSSNGRQGTPTPGGMQQRRDDMANMYSSSLVRNGSPASTRQNGGLESTPEYGYMAGMQGGQRRESFPHEQRQPRALEERGRLPQVEMRDASRPRPPMDRIERTQTLARREVERAEVYQSRLDEREASNGGRAAFQDNISRLNKVWAAQEAQRLRAGAEDAKIFNGVKYERKMNGPFQGKLVSQGAIITIDGEDYVEYRVLTKPSFF